MASQKNTFHISLLTESMLALLMACGFIMVAATAVSAAATTTTISSTVTPVMGLFTSDGTVNVDVTPAGSGVQTIASDTVTVSTSDTNGYTLQLSQTGTNTALVSGSEQIAAGSGTRTAPTTLTTNTWGYRVDGVGGFGIGPTAAQSNGPLSAHTFAGVPLNSAPDTIKTTTTTASNDTTTVWFSVAADTTLPAGTYTSNIMYTGITN
jgi:hypothetical protein